MSSNHIRINSHKQYKNFVYGDKMVQEIQNWSELESNAANLPKDRLLVVDCYAPWCGPCKSMAPFFNELATNYPDCTFLKANVDEIDELTSELKVSAMPTFIFIKGSMVVDKLEGSSQSKLLRLIEKYT